MTAASGVERQDGPCSIERITGESGSAAKSAIAILQQPELTQRSGVRLRLYITGTTGGDDAASKVFRIAGVIGYNGGAQPGRIRRQQFQGFGGLAAILQGGGDRSGFIDQAAVGLYLRGQPVHTTRDNGSIVGVIGMGRLRPEHEAQGKGKKQVLHQAMRKRTHSSLSVAPSLADEKLFIHQTNQSHKQAVDWAMGQPAQTAARIVKKHG